MSENFQTVSPGTSVNKGKKKNGHHLGTNEAPEGLRWEDPPGLGNAQNRGWLFDVTVLRLGVGDRKLFCRRLSRDEERWVEHRINVALVAHNMRFVGTFIETIARLQDSLLAVRAIFSCGTRGNRNQSDPGMTVPASGASGFDDNLYTHNVCRTWPAFHRDAVVLSFDLP